MASGLLALTILPGCTRTVELPVNRPVPVAVKVDDRPPAELTRCANRSARLAEDPGSWAVLPPRVRESMIAFARAFGANADQLDRLVNWNVPGSCPAKEPK